VARPAEAVEINFQLTPSFLSAGRAVAFLIAHGEERCDTHRAWFLSGKRR